ncbi:MAG: helix-turn-helix domain-containing protein [Nanoarchaeota archaeon]|nr:helix-turn-helix domain-containing protein [Nanoarchaeota archaeon]
MDLRTTLEHIGLTKTETTLYLTLLDIGPSQAGIISRRSGIHRRSVYDAAERLIKKGLLGYIKSNNKRQYAAVNPERLLELAEEQTENVHSILNELKAKYITTEEKQETLFYKGQQAIKNVLEDQLATGEDVYVLGASGKADQQLPFYLHWYTKRRIQKKIKLKLLYNGTPGKKKKIPHAETRYLPGPQEPIATNIYGNKIAIIFWKEKPSVIVINKRDMATMYKSYFEHLWKMAKT